MSAPTESNQGFRPSHLIYAVMERPGDATAFSYRVGMMFPCEGGFSLILEQIPRDPKTRLVAQEQGADVAP